MSVPPASFPGFFDAKQNSPVRSESLLRSGKGFTLLELVTVMAILVLIAGFTTSGMRNIVAGDDLSQALIGISGAFETARQYAIANDTYTWVGMANSSDPGNGLNKVTVAVFASLNGLRSGGADPQSMRLVSKIARFDTVQLLTAKPAGNKLSNLPDAGIQIPTPQDSQFRPTSSDMPSQLQSLPLDWVVIFSPRGEACIDASPVTSSNPDVTGDSLSPGQAIRMWVTSCRGATPSQPENASASMIQVNGVTGQVDVFHP